MALSLLAFIFDVHLDPNLYLPDFTEWFFNHVDDDRGHGDIHSFDPDRQHPPILHESADRQIAGIFRLFARSLHADQMGNWGYGRLRADPHCLDLRCRI